MWLLGIAAAVQQAGRVGGQVVSIEPPASVGTAAVMPQGQLQTLAAQPAQPIAAQPAQLVAAQPAQPIAAQPSQFVAAQPAQFIAVQPAQPVAAQPVAAAQPQPQHQGQQQIVANLNTGVQRAFQKFNELKQDVASLESAVKNNAPAAPPSAPPSAAAAAPVLPGAPATAPTSATAAALAPPSAPAAAPAQPVASVDAPGTTSKAAVTVRTVANDKTQPKESPGEAVDPTKTAGEEPVKILGTAALDTRPAGTRVLSWCIVIGSIVVLVGLQLSYLYVFLYGPELWQKKATDKLSNYAASDVHSRPSEAADSSDDGKDRRRQNHHHNRKARSPAKTPASAGDAGGG